jgi:hypothetical protein
MLLLKLIASDFLVVLALAQRLLRQTPGKRCQDKTPFIEAGVGELSLVN